MRWLELKKYNSADTIFVNMEHVSSMERTKSGRKTMIWFSAGHTDGQVLVQEEPHAILDMLYDRPPA